jgi:hypothetical protein
MIKIKVKIDDINFAKNQISAFEKIELGKWRYSNVESWRGIVCEMLTSDWLESNFEIEKKAKGLDSSGIIDDCDMVINSKKVEIKSATKILYKFLMPKIYDVRDKPKDIYIGAKYNERVEPNEVWIMGYMRREDIFKYSIKQNMGAPYYEIPFEDLLQINENTFK